MTQNIQEKSNGKKRKKITSTLYHNKVHTLLFQEQLVSQQGSFSHCADVLEYCLNREIAKKFLILHFCVKCFYQLNLYMQSKVGKINEYDKNIAVNKNDQQ